MAQLGSYGDVIFEVSSDLVRTFEAFRRETSASYAVHETVSGKPSLEFTGKNLDRIEMTMKFNAQCGVNPEEEDQRLRDLAHKGEAHPVILGDKVYGNFVIENVDGDSQYFIKGGFRVIEVNIRLIEYDTPATGPGADALARDKAGRRIPSALQGGL